MNMQVSKQTWIIAGLLLLTMVLTRSQLISHIQDTSWAVFFLLGFYIRRAFALGLFFIVAFAVDLLVIQAQGGENFCFTPSYPFLIPAYAALWGGGRWFANHYQENLRGGIYFLGAAVIGITASFLVSNFGFYWFSGRFPDMSSLEYVLRIAKYLPMYLQTTLLYLGIAGVIHLAVTHANKLSDTRPHA